MLCISGVNISPRLVTRLPSPLSLLLFYNHPISTAPNPFSKIPTQLLHNSQTVLENGQHLLHCTPGSSSCYGKIRQSTSASDAIHCFPTLPECSHSLGRKARQREWKSKSYKGHISPRKGCFASVNASKRHSRVKPATLAISKVSRRPSIPWRRKARHVQPGSFEVLVYEQTARWLHQFPRL